jgi:hypothetical protein
LLPNYKHERLPGTRITVKMTRKLRAGLSKVAVRLGGRRKGIDAGEQDEPGESSVSQQAKQQSPPRDAEGDLPMPDSNEHDSEYEDGYIADGNEDLSMADIDPTAVNNSPFAGDLDEYNPLEDVSSDEEGV